jgi:hypothetical protein
MGVVGKGEIHYPIFHIFIFLNSSMNIRDAMSYRNTLDEVDNTA